MAQRFTRRGSVPPRAVSRWREPDNVQSSGETEGSEMGDGARVESMVRAVRDVEKLAAAAGREDLAERLGKT